MGGQTILSSFRCSENSGGQGRKGLSLSARQEVLASSVPAKTPGPGVPSGLPEDLGFEAQFPHHILTNPPASLRLHHPQDGSLTTTQGSCSSLPGSASFLWVSAPWPWWTFAETLPGCLIGKGIWRPGPRHGLSKADPACVCTRVRAHAHGKGFACVKSWESRCRPHMSAPLSRPPFVRRREISCGVLPPGSSFPRAPPPRDRPGLCTGCGLGPRDWACCPHSPPTFGPSSLVIGPFHQGTLRARAEPQHQLQLVGCSDRGSGGGGSSSLFSPGLLAACRWGRRGRTGGATALEPTSPASLSFPFCTNSTGCLVLAPCKEESGAVGRLSEQNELQLISDVCREQRRGRQRPQRRSPALS